jgi:hypothetical protein
VSWPGNLAKAERDRRAPRRLRGGRHAEPGRAPDILSPRKDHHLGRAFGTSFGWRERHPRH